MGTFLDSLPNSGIVRIRELMYAVDRPFRLDQGDVSFDAPETFKAAMHAAIDANQTHYLQTAGLPRLKALLAEKLRAQNGVPVRSDDEVLVTNGGVHAIYLAAQALVEPGDEVIVPDPEWPPATLAMLAARASVVRCPLHPSLGWRFDVDEVASLIGPRTKGLYLNSPNNPTGGVFTRGDLERLADLAREHDLWVIADEAYEDVLYDGAEHVSIASLPGMYERTRAGVHVQQDVRGDRPARRLPRGPRRAPARPPAEAPVPHDEQRVVRLAVRGHRRARRLAGRRRAVPGGTAGAAGPVLCRRSGGRRPRLQRRAAPRRLLRVPAHRPGVDNRPLAPRRLHARGRWRSI